MKIIITIDTDNAAFEGDPGFETARILRNIVSDLECPPFEREHWHGYKLRDSNGNTVGSVKVQR